MELNTIQRSGSWGSAADSLNQNFNKVNTEVEKLNNATVRNKGYFSSESELNSAHPSSSTGDIAYIKVDGYTPFERWRWNGSSWVGTGVAGGDDDVELGNYYTRDETDNIFVAYDREAHEIDGISSTLVTDALRETDMTDIITLKDNVTEKPMYPRTVTNAVVDENGNPLDSLLEVVNEELEKTLYGSVTDNPASILD